MRNRNHQKKEKFIMLASSVLVLSALTLTGVYVKERTRIQNENSAKLSREEEMTETETEESASPANVAKAVNPQADDALESDFGSYSARLYEEDNIDEMAQVEEAEGLAQTEEGEAAKTVNSKGVSLSFSPQEGLVWPIVGKQVAFGSR